MINEVVLKENRLLFLKIYDLFETEKNSFESLTLN